jgi:hypothetical protein
MPYFSSRSTYNFTKGPTGESNPTVVNLTNMASWAKAEASLLTEGPVSPEILASRLEACRGCERLDTEAVSEGQVGWCRACGCGRNARAELTIKATMPKAKCPENKWPAADG